MSADPLLNSFLELLDEGERVNTEPADIYRLLHLTDLLLDASQVLDLLVEDVETGEAGDYFLKDLGTHP